MVYLHTLIKEMRRLIPVFTSAFLFFFLWITAVSAAPSEGKAAPKSQVKASHGHLQTAAHMACCLEVETESPRPVSRQTGLFGACLVFQPSKWLFLSNVPKPIKASYVLADQPPLYLLFLQLKLGKIERTSKG